MSSVEYKIPVDSFNDLSKPYGLYLYTKLMFDARNGNLGTKYAWLSNIRGISFITGRLPQFVDVSGLSKYACPVCGIRFAPNAYVYRCDHIDVEMLPKPLLLTQLLHISCGDKLFVKGSYRTGSAAGLTTEQHVGLWSTFGKYHRGEHIELPKTSRCVQYIHQKSLGIVKNIQQFLEYEEAGLYV